jgi:hypothetical protein
MIVEMASIVGSIWSRSALNMLPVSIELRPPRTSRRLPHRTNRNPVNARRRCACATRYDQARWAAAATVNVRRSIRSLRIRCVRRTYRRQAAQRLSVREFDQVSARFPHDDEQADAGAGIDGPSTSVPVARTRPAIACTSSRVVHWNPKWSTGWPTTPRLITTTKSGSLPGAGAGPSHTVRPPSRRRSRTTARPHISVKKRIEPSTSDTGIVKCVQRDRHRRRTVVRLGKLSQKLRMTHPFCG